MTIRMILFPQFPIIPLNNLQPLLLALTLRQIIQFSIQQIFSIVWVRVKRILIVNHLIGFLLYTVKFLPVDKQGLNPSASQFTQTLFNVLFTRTYGVLSIFWLEKTANKRLSYTDYLPIYLVTELPFTLWKHAWSILEVYSTEKTIFRINDVGFSLKSKFPVAHRQSRKLSRTCLEYNLGSVVKLNCVKSLV